MRASVWVLTATLACTYGKRGGLRQKNRRAEAVEAATAADAGEVVDPLGYYRYRWQEPTDTCGTELHVDYDGTRAWNWGLARRCVNMYAAYRGARQLARSACIRVTRSLPLRPDACMYPFTAMHACTHLPLSKLPCYLAQGSSRCMRLGLVAHMHTYAWAFPFSYRVCTFGTTGQKPARRHRRRVPQRAQSATHPSRGRPLLSRVHGPCSAGGPLCTCPAWRQSEGAPDVERGTGTGAAG